MASCPKRLKAEISKEKSNYTRLCCLVNFAEKVLPSSTSKNVEDDLATIRQYRSKLGQMHSNYGQPSISDVYFEDYWKDISDALIRLGGEKYNVSISDHKDLFVLTDTSTIEIDDETHETSIHTKRKKNEDFSKGKHQLS